MTYDTQTGATGSDLISEAKRRYFATQQALNSALWSICSILRRSHCSGALQYIPELTWVLFLRILDEQERREGDALPSLVHPFRWQDWATPGSAKRRQWKDSPGAALAFVNQELFPYLKSLHDSEDTTPRQRIISKIMGGIEQTHIANDQDLLEVLDKIHAIELDGVDQTHIFALSQVYEGLLLRMSDKASDGGQFFTPREVVRLMIEVVAPEIGMTVYDPCCGTGGFLAQCYEYIQSSGANDTPKRRETLKQKMFYGREKESLIYPIALANLVLHGIDEPHIWHGNTLAKTADGGLFQENEQYDIILTNPPFGGKESEQVKRNFDFQTSASQVLFLQHVIASLKPGGRCGIVLDEGVLFRTNEVAFVETKKLLLSQCDLWCIVSLPDGVFTAAGALVKTNLLFFTKGTRTENIWYYDLSDVKIGKRTPFTREQFTDFLRLLPDRANSKRSWTISRKQIEARCYDLKAVNPYVKHTREVGTQQELLAQMLSKQAELQRIMEELVG